VKNDNTKRFKAVALCRVSTARQRAEGSSLEAQEKYVYECAAYHTADIVKMWSLDTSSKKGKNLARKDLNEIMQYCKQTKGISYLILDEVDRFMRSVDEYYWWKVEFKKIGVFLAYAKLPEITHQDNPMAVMREMMEVFRAEASNYERISKTTDKMQARVAAGYYPSNPKTGYQRTETAGLHAPKEPEWSMLRSGFLQVLEGIPIKEVVAGINAAGYKQRTGKFLDTHRFKIMLNDPFYAGIIQMSSWTVNPNGLHKAMITPEQHEQLKNIVKGVVYTPHKQYNPEFPLSKIMTCKECLEEGAKNPKIVGYVNNNGRGNYYQRYRCRACKKNYILRDDLHDELGDILAGLRLAEAKVKDFLAGLRHVWEQEQATSFNTTEGLKSRLSSLENDKKNVVLKQALGQLSDDRADIAIEALDEDIATIKQQIESIATVEQDFVEFVEFALSTVEGFRDKFWQLDQEHQVWCKQLLFPDGFSVSRDKKVYTPTISDFYLCINTEKSHENDSFTADSSIWYTLVKEVQTIITSNIVT
jgi:site-specific DNA recombinase